MLTRAKLQEIIKGYYFAGNVGVLLLGDRGIGKTEFAKDVARHIVDYWLIKRLTGENISLYKFLESYVATLDSRTADNLKRMIETLSGYTSTKNLYNFIQDLLASFIAFSNQKRKEKEERKQCDERELVDMLYWFLLDKLVLWIPSPHMNPEQLVFIAPDIQKEELKVLPVIIPPFAVVVLDELTNINEELEKFLLTFILSNRIYNLTYPGVFFIATGNRIEQSELARLLSAPAMERFAIYDYPLLYKEEFLPILFDITISKWGEQGINVFEAFSDAFLKSSLDVYERLTMDDLLNMRRRISPRGWEQFLNAVIGYLQVNAYDEKAFSDYIDKLFEGLFKGSYEKKKAAFDDFKQRFIANYTKLKDLGNIRFPLLFLHTKLNSKASVSDDDYNKLVEEVDKLKQDAQFGDMLLYFDIFTYYVYKNKEEAGIISNVAFYERWNFKNYRHPLLERLMQDEKFAKFKEYAEKYPFEQGREVKAEEELKERGVEVDVYGIEIQGDKIGHAKVNEAHL